MECRPDGLGFLSDSLEQGIYCGHEMKRNRAESALKSEPRQETETREQNDRKRTKVVEIEEGRNLATERNVEKSAERNQKETKKKKKKRKSGKVTVVPLATWRPLASLKEARHVTSQFHNLTKELEAASNNLTERARAAELQSAIDKLGGRTRYQEASMLLTQQHSGSSHWVFRQVTALGLRPSRGEAPLRTLEVGAINTQLLSCPFLDVTAIDLKSRHPRVVERDFFDLPCPPERLFDVISNAMVINCVPTALDRGEMLVSSMCVLCLRPSGDARSSSDDKRIQ